VLALLAAAVALAPGATAQEPVRIALLPVVVHSAEDPDYLRAGLADMLVARLDQVGVFDVVRVEDPALATTRIDEAVRRGAEVGADFVLFGSFTRFGQGASLDMQCASTDATGTPLREIFVHSGSIGDVIPDLDELVGKVSRFAVADYEQRAPGSAAADAPRDRPSVEKLRRRLEALERDVRELKRAAEDAEKERQAQRAAAAKR